MLSNLDCHGTSSSSIHTRQQVFALDNMDIYRGLLGLIRRHYQIEEHPPVNRKTFYLDTFDGRLWRHGLIGEYQTQGRRKVFIVRRNQHGDVVSETPVEHQPEFFSDIPSWLRPENIRPILKMRKLLYQVASESRVHSVSILNEKGRVVVTLEMVAEQLMYRNHRKGGSLPYCLKVHSSRGELHHYEKVLDVIQPVDLARMKDDAQTQLMALQGTTPGTYSNKINVRFNKKMRAIKAYQLLFLKLTTIMQQNEAGINDDIDTEFLHDFRVSVRRTRSLLSCAKGVLPIEVIQKISNEFRWLGTITSPLRDFDVWLLSFNRYQTSLPKELRSNLEPLRHWLQQNRAENLRAVTKALTSERYIHLMQEWHELMQSDLASRFADAQQTPNSLKPVMTVARKRIWKTYMTLRHRGALIDDDSPPKRLHDLRKTGKRLRYMLEFFQSLFPGKKIRIAIEKMEKLQDYLGTYQDYEVQKNSLHAFMDGMRASGELDDASKEAIEYLINDIDKRELEHRKGFLKYFEAFTHPDIHKLYSRQFS